MVTGQVGLEESVVVVEDDLLVVVVEMSLKLFVSRMASIQNYSPAQVTSISYVHIVHHDSQCSDVASRRPQDVIGRTPSSSTSSSPAWPSSMHTAGIGSTLQSGGGHSRVHTCSCSHAGPHRLLVLRCCHHCRRPDGRLSWIGPKTSRLGCGCHSIGWKEIRRSVHVAVWALGNGPTFRLGHGLRPLRRACPRTRRMQIRLGCGPPTHFAGDHTCIGEGRQTYIKGSGSTMSG